MTDGVGRSSSIDGLHEACLPIVFPSSHSSNLLALRNGDLLCADDSGTWRVRPAASDFLLDAAAYTATLTPRKKCISFAWAQGNCHVGVPVSFRQRARFLQQELPEKKRRTPSRLFKPDVVRIYGGGLFVFRFSGRFVIHDQIPLMPEQALDQTAAFLKKRACVSFCTQAAFPAHLISSPQVSGHRLSFLEQWRSHKYLLRSSERRASSTLRHRKARCRAAAGHCRERASSVNTQNRP